MMNNNMNFNFDNDGLETIAMEFEAYYAAGENEHFSLYGASSRFASTDTHQETQLSEAAHDFLDLGSEAISTAKKNFKSQPANKLHAGEKTFFTGTVGGSMLDTGFKRDDLFAGGWPICSSGVAI